METKGRSTRELPPDGLFNHSDSRLVLPSTSTRRNEKQPMDSCSEVLGLSEEELQQKHRKQMTDLQGRAKEYSTAFLSVVAICEILTR